MKSRLQGAGRNFGTNIVIGGTAFAAATAMLVALTPVEVLRAMADSKILSELAARSPGKRVGGVALKAKKRYVVKRPTPALPKTPVKTVLATEVTPEGPVPTWNPDTISVPTDFEAPMIPVEQVPEPAYAQAPGRPIFGVVGLIFGFNQPRGGGMGVLPVPEPATWLSLIVGFGVIGATMRGRRRVVTAHA